MAVRSASATGITIGPSQGGKPSNRYTNFTNATASTHNTASLTMGGFGSSWALTPSSTGRVRVLITGYINNSAVGGAVFTPRYGTGAAPVATAAVTGTAPITTDYAVTATTATVPFTIYYEVTGLTLATAYWFDIAARNTTATTTMSPTTIMIEEF